MLFSRAVPEREQVEIPDKQPVCVFEGRKVNAQLFDPTEEGISGEEFGRAAKKFLQRGLSGVFETEGADAIESRGIVAQRVADRSRFQRIKEEEKAKKEKPVVDELSVFEQRMLNLNTDSN